MTCDPDIRRTSQARHARARRGFTLVELVVSMAIAVVLMGGMMSALVIAGRANGSGSESQAHVREARESADQLLAELNHALAFTEQGSNSLAFLVPDRDGDGSAEVIRYAWSGVSGAALTREYNGGGAVAFANSIDRFDLTYLPRLFPAVAEESYTAILIEYGGSQGGSYKDCDIDQNKWCAQYFKPAMPTNTVSWSVNRVRVTLKQESLDRQLRIQIRPPTPRLIPTDQVLQEVAVSTSSLPLTYLNLEYEFSEPAVLDPSMGACLVITQVSNTVGARVRYLENGVSMPQNTHWTTTSDAGLSWTIPTANQDMLFAAYGTVVTEGPPQWP